MHLRLLNEKVSIIIGITTAITLVLALLWRFFLVDLNGMRNGQELQEISAIVAKIQQDQFDQDIMLNTLKTRQDFYESQCE